MFFTALLPSFLEEKMRALVGLLFIIAVAAADSLRDFEAFKVKYAKQYNSHIEEAARFEYFVENIKKAAAMQATNPLAMFGAGVFADRSASELKIMHNAEAFLSKRAAKPRKEAPVPVLDSPVSSIDWRQKGAVTYVKNQGQCGSCWSFSTTGNIEGQWFLAGNKLVALSEQQLVSCDTIDQGCSGGFQDDAFEWLFFKTNGTITTETAYPYVSGTGDVPTCRKDTLPFGAQISDYNDVARDETVDRTSVV